MKRQYSDNQKAMAAIKYAQANRAVADAIKTALHLAPGSTADELHEALRRTHDITMQHTVFMLYGLKILGTIKAVGIGGTNSSKKWALSDAKLEEVSLDLQIDEAVLALVRQGPQWMANIVERVVDSVPTATNKDVTRELRTLVRARRLEPIRCKFRPGELYPDIQLMNPTTKTATPKLSLANIVIFQKLEELKATGVRQILFDELRHHFDMTSPGLRKHLEKLHQAGSIHLSRPGSGRYSKSMVTLDLSLLGVQDIEKAREKVTDVSTEEEPKPQPSLYAVGGSGAEEVASGGVTGGEASAEEDTDYVPGGGDNPENSGGETTSD